VSLNKYALDSSAILAAFYHEPGADFVNEILRQSVVSSVNFAECIGKMACRGIPAEEAKTALKDLITEVIAFDHLLAFTTGELAAATRPFGLSLGDRACIATALHLGLEAVTADKIWAKLKLPIKIKFIR
jgi:PIN domain nuclease of toxin-antitoxin system